jgi:pimeloyl-ACP methyl ester carboxylesterase
MSDRPPCRIGVAALLCLGWLASLKGAEPISLTITAGPSPATELSLRWNDAGPDWHYSVQSRPALNQGVWLTRSDQRPWPVIQPEWSGLTSDPAQFYRVLTVPAADRGRLLAFDLESPITLPEITILLQLAEIPLTPLYEVELYRLVYETVDPWGGRTQASGAVALPVGVGRPLPLMSYQHGTLVLTNEGPSALNEQILPGVGFASIGYAVVLPDLLGFGDSPGLHPYHHARSEATAGVDALRAVRSWCAGNSRELNGQLFLVGYSQGGHATMALQRELELYHRDEFPVTASAPMAGAYDLSGVTANHLLSGRPMPNPYYLIYLLAAYQEVYSLTNSLSDLLSPPYDTVLPPLMNGATPSGTINDAMPADARLILRPVVLDALEAQPQHPIRVALQDNDLYRWTPTAPTRLYHCRGDQDVIYANSETAYSSFHSRGAVQVQLIDPDPTADHTGCVLPAFILAKDWFETLRQ